MQNLFNIFIKWDVLLFIPEENGKITQIVTILNIIINLDISFDMLKAIVKTFSFLEVI